MRRVAGAVNVRSAGVRQPLRQGGDRTMTKSLLRARRAVAISPLVAAEPVGLAGGFLRL